MRSNFRNLALMTALAVGATGVNLMPTVVIAQDQDHHDDRDHNQQGNYANSRFYQMGQREGEQDRARNRQRKNHNHHYRSDGDRQAHDAGYQTGWGGGDQNMRHDEHRDDHHDDHQDQPH